MPIWLLIVGAIVLLFGLGAIMGAPYLPTLKKEGEIALDMLGLKAGETLLDMGAGTGSLLLLAAQRGVKGIGWEINPLLVVYAKLRLWPYRQFIDIRWCNMWRTKLPNVDGVYIFGIERYMKKFANKLNTEISTPTKVLSYTFKIPGKSPVKRNRGLTLYRYAS